MKKTSLIALILAAVSLLTACTPYRRGDSNRTYTPGHGGHGGH